MTAAVLLLPFHHTVDDSAIWRAAVGRGLKTARGKVAADFPEYLGTSANSARLYYYGNTLHATRLMEGGIALRVAGFDPDWVTAPEVQQALGRAVTPMTYGAFAQLADQTRTYFVKCVHEKWFKPAVCTPASLPTNSCLPGDMLHVQDVVAFVDEVRCWVIDGRILTWSYYRKDGTLWGQGITDDPPLPDWQRLIAAVAPHLPRVIVIDVGRDARGWHVIEANEPWASGIYDCNPERCLDVILASQE